jgi:hypothetical protein
MKLSPLLPQAALPASTLGACQTGEVPFGATCSSQDTVYAQAYDYLSKNMPSWDVTNANTLGFGGLDDADGLDDGVAVVGINASIASKQDFAWAGDVGMDTWLEYIVPYAHVNEGRTNWRPLLRGVVDRIVAAADAAPASAADAVALINANMWHAATSGLPNDVVFKSSQTPLIYDPMSTLVYGYASCTGVSILFANALRAAGIPARIAGTPAWNGAVENGNHNWIEVFVDGDWAFVEAAPAGGGETLSNPCDKWFCNPAHTNGTSFYATRWEKTSDGVVYPMAWDFENVEIAGVDRTSYYAEACASC